MPVAVSLRFDDDLAHMLRERAEIERCSINRLVNLGMRDYLQRTVGGGAPAPEDERRIILRSLARHFENLEDAIHGIEHPENTPKKARDAFQSVKSILTLLAAAIDPSVIPVVEDFVEEARV